MADENDDKTVVADEPHEAFDAETADFSWMDGTPPTTAADEPATDHGVYWIHTDVLIDGNTLYRTFRAGYPWLPAEPPATFINDVQRAFSRGVTPEEIILAILCPENKKFEVKSWEAVRSVVLAKPGTVEKFRYICEMTKMYHYEP